MRWEASEEEKHNTVSRRVAAPKFTPKGGEHWQWWEPGGATRVTHWDPITITCETPGEIFDMVWACMCIFDIHACVCVCMCVRVRVRVRAIRYLAQPPEAFQRIAL